MNGSVLVIAFTSFIALVKHFSTSLSTSSLITLYSGKYKQLSAFHYWICWWASFCGGSGLMLENSYYTCLIAILFDNGIGIP